MAKSSLSVPTTQVLRLQQHLVVGEIRDGAAGGERGEACAAPAAQDAVDRIAMDQRPAPAAPRGEAVGQHGHDLVEPGALQRPVRPGAAQEGVELVLLPLPRRHLGHDLLGQHVERLRGEDDPVQLAALGGIDQRRALHEIVARQREQPALGRAVDGMAGAADALQEGGDGAGRAQLADQIDLADVDAQLQRRRGHQHLELAGLEPLLGVQPPLLGEAAVMGGDARPRRCAPPGAARRAPPAAACWRRRAWYDARPPAPPAGRRPRPTRRPTSPLRAGTRAARYPGRACACARGRR